MNGNLVKDLIVLGLIAVVIVPPLLAEVAETAETRDMATGEILISSSPGEYGGASAQLLNVDEAASLAARVEIPGEAVAGGALTNQQLTYIVIALAAAVVVLILV